MTVFTQSEISSYNDQESWLATYTGSSAKIQEHFALFEEAIFFVELYELEGCSCSVAFLLGKLIVFVETALAMSLLNTHLLHS